MRVHWDERDDPYGPGRIDSADVLVDVVGAPSPGKPHETRATVTLWRVPWDGNRADTADRAACELDALVESLRRCPPAWGSSGPRIQVEGAPTRAAYAQPEDPPMPLRKRFYLHVVAVEPAGDVPDRADGWRAYRFTCDVGRYDQLRRDDRIEFVRHVGPDARPEDLYFLGEHAALAWLEETLFLALRLTGAGRASTFDRPHWLRAASQLWDALFPSKALRELRRPD